MLQELNSKPVTDVEPINLREREHIIELPEIFRHWNSITRRHRNIAGDNAAFKIEAHNPIRETRLHRTSPFTLSMPDERLQLPA